MSLPSHHLRNSNDFRDHVPNGSRSSVLLLRKRGSVIDRRIQVVLMLIEENFNQQIAIAEIARMVNLSPGRLAHLFKSETGVAVQQYLTQIRLAKAQHQLESSFLSIKEIAAAVGFTSVTRFATSFKTLVGMTPAQYRKLAATFHPNRKDPVIARSANE